MEGCLFEVLGTLLGCLALLVVVAILLFPFWWVARQLFERAEHAPCPTCGSRDTEILDAGVFSSGTTLFPSYSASTDWECQNCRTHFSTSGKVYHPTTRHWWDLYGSRKKQEEDGKTQDEEKRRSREALPGERILLDEDGVLVSDSRVVTSDRAYQVSSIKSVRKFSSSPRQRRAIAPLLIGLLIMLSSSTGMQVNPIGSGCGLFLGVTILGVALAWLRSLGSRYHISALLRSGKTQTFFSSPDELMVDRIVASIGNAIHHKSGESNSA